MSDHTVVRTFVFFVISAVIYGGISLIAKIFNTRTLSSFMFGTSSDMLWQILAVGAGIAIALQVSINTSSPVEANKPNARAVRPAVFHESDTNHKLHSMIHYTPTLIAVGVTFPTLDYLSSFIMRPERQLVQWPAWEMTSAFCFTVAITALCMNAQISHMHATKEDRDQ